MGSVGRADAMHMGQSGKAIPALLRTRSRIPTCQLRDLFGCQARAPACLVLGGDAEHTHVGG